MVSPMVVPRVSHKPVGDVIFYAPAQNSDSVKSYGITEVVLVHTCKEKAILKEMNGQLKFD
jgi:hypothetical protein